MDSYSKYDLLLGGIGLMIIVMLVGLLVAPLATIAGSVIAAVMVGVALFIIPPIDNGTTRTPGTRGVP